jgi:TonB family protein
MLMLHNLLQSSRVALVIFTGVAWAVTGLWGITPTKKVDPVVPPVAASEGRPLEAVIAVTINKKGKPQNCAIESTNHPAFGQAALQAAKQWRFEPILENGKPVEKRVNIPFRYAVPYKERLNEEMGREVFRELDPERTIIDLANVDEDLRPQPIKRVQPQYPEELIGSRKKGEVVVTYIVDENGTVVNPVVKAASQSEFVMPALKAAVMTEWKPLVLRRGGTVYQRVTETYSFKEGMKPVDQVEDPASDDSGKEKGKKPWWKL